MKHIKLAAVVLVLALVSAIVLGCSGLDNDKKLNTPPVNPIDEGNKSISVTLYYGFSDNIYLSGDTRKIKISANQLPEAAVLEELLKGPSADKLELHKLINDEARVLKISASEKTLSVTFNDKILSPSTGTPADWYTNSELVKEVNRNKTLAVYSIINTITGMGNFNKVQILVDPTGTGEAGSRVARKELGFIEDAEKDNLLEPLARSSDVILNPGNTVDAFLSHASAGNWTSAYAYIADVDKSGKTKPILDEFLRQMTLGSVAVVKKSVSDDAAVAPDGQSAVVMIPELQVRLRGAEPRRWVQISLPIKRERECWKIDYSFIQEYLLLER